MIRFPGCSGLHATSSATCNVQADARYGLQRASPRFDQSTTKPSSNRSFLTHSVRRSHPYRLLTVRSSSFLPGTSSTTLKLPQPWVGRRRTSGFVSIGLESASGNGSAAPTTRLRDRH